ncbi:zf-HC2 domain-containing protein [Streptomyces sp. NPDC002004]
MFASLQECRTIRELLAGYALGALAPDDALPVRVHLATCTGCRDEHECLAAVSAHLPLLRAALARDTGRQLAARYAPARPPAAARRHMSRQACPARAASTVPAPNRFPGCVPR